ncbi:transmembrane and coiled-coil domains protein 2 isoform X2 [Halyomorpha halys]|uniref:transmembrane and coiled-coil domains protein 2 isoform X2 n=1 Tax=Halyomorpha halys TaxID=286706 RepID=UPI0034D1C178
MLFESYVCLYQHIFTVMLMNNYYSLFIGLKRSLREPRMSRCKSPVSSRHERCSSIDTAIQRTENFGNQGFGEETALNTTQEDDMDGSVLNGSMDLGDDGDGSKTRAAIEHMYTKIARTKDLIKGEQTARDDNVNEYLKLASNADKTQVQRIKAVFEKKNQKSAQCIQQLQKKLESYNKKLKELETKGVQAHHHRQPREVLRDMGQGLKSVMSKPREFAHLIRNKFGSADNINSLSRNGESDSLEEEKTHHGSATLPGGCSLNSGLKFTSEEGSECSSVTSESMPGGAQTTSPPSSTTHPQNVANTPNIEMVYAELRVRKHESERMREQLESMKKMMEKEVNDLNQALTEERFRCERLEEQVNDLTELHQNEVENLKTAISDMEEKVQYQSEERLRDIHDMLESCQTKISKMEHQQAQHQQYLTLEGIDNSYARAFLVKLINVVLTVLQVILLVVATAAGIIMPFLRTRLHILTTAILVVAFVIVMKQWHELTELSTQLTSRFRIFSQG